MAKLEDILKSEVNRQDTSSMLVIHLYQEGSFLRAYEWSAWLCYRYLSSFKATRRVIKSTQESIVFVGFPLTSLEKFRGHNQVVSTGDKCMDILLDESLVMEKLSEDDFNHWKQSVPLTESKKTHAIHVISNDIDTNYHPTITGIMHKILAYPIEQKSPIDCMVFMADIKQQLSLII